MTAGKTTGEDSRHWLAQPNVSRAWAVTAALLWFFVLLVIGFTPLGHYLEARLAHPIDFRLRELVGQSPTIDPRLKIYVLDDKSVAENDSWVMSIETWRDILKGIAAAKPKAIFIDAVFGFVPEASRESGAAAIRDIEALDVPVITGAFVTPARIDGRQPLKLDGDDFRIETRLAPSSIPDARLHLQIREHAPQIVDATSRNVYGPMVGLERAFRRPGHINYGNDNRVAPFFEVRTDADGESRLLPHITSWLAGEQTFKDGKYFAGDRVVPVDRDGYVQVNVLPEARWFDASRRLGPVIARVADGEPITSVKADDVVLILPMMFTGHTDFAATPFGDMAGGWVLASMLNSYLTGEFLTPISQGWVLTLLAALGGMWLAAGLRTRPYFLWSLAASAAFLFVAFGLFIGPGVSVSWLYPVCAFWLTGLTVFAEKSRVAERKAMTLRLALDGAVGADELRNIMRHPELVRLEARERVITLMFIDVVGFSVVAENMLPRLAFENLKKILNSLSETIHRHGGIIDKTLGDGLLCYFGYSFDSDFTSPDHAEQALRCAIRIQQDNLTKILEAHAAREAIYPLRIGINTASCYLGDLGTSQRIDFTVVGNGVNFAKRLEGACEVHSVLVGATTRDLVTGVGLESSAISRRLIRIKHHSELVEAYEYDPFHDKRELRDTAVAAFRSSSRVERHEQRWPVKDTSRIRVMTEFGPGEIVNFSWGGLSIRLPQFLGQGTSVSVSLDSPDGRLKSTLKDRELATIVCEVRWGYAADGGFVHGLTAREIDREQGDFLVQMITQFAFGDSGDANHDKDAV